MAGDVGGVGGSRFACGPEWPLCDPPVLGAREDGAPVLELIDVARRLRAEDLDRILVTQVVGALDGVEGVLLRIVVGRVSERRVDAAFGRPRVASHRMDLGDNGHVRPAVVGFDCGAHAGETGAHHQHVVLGIHQSQTLSDRTGAPAS